MVLLEESFTTLVAHVRSQRTAAVLVPGKKRTNEIHKTYIYIYLEIFEAIFIHFKLAEIVYSCQSRESLVGFETILYDF